VLAVGVAVAVAVAALTTATGAPAVAESRPFVLADLARIVSISEPQLAPDGRRAVALISRIDTEHNRSNEEIDLIDLAGGAPRSLTYERTGLAEPAWSPDGTRIAFIANSGEGDAGRPQVFVMPLAGGDARRVTAAPDGVDQFSWRPDGGAIAYVAVDPKPHTAGAQRFVDAYEVGNGSNLLPGAARSYRIWLQPLRGGNAQLLTPGAGSVTNGEATTTLSFSPDGTALAYSWAPNAILNDADFAATRILDLTSHAATPLTAHGKREQNPLFAPDGRHIAYLYADGDNQTHPQEAYVTTRGGGSGENISHAVDAYVHDVAWQPDGRALYFSSTLGTHSAVWRYVPGSQPVPVDLGGLSTLSPLDGAIGNDGTLLFVASSTTRPAELYVRAPGGAPRRLTSYNSGVADRTFGIGERITFPTSTGITGDGVLIRPPGFTPARRYPLVLIIHGGPTEASTESFDDLGQLMANRGWLVLEPNYRGSDNLGRAYLAAIFNDVSTGPGRDIMAAVDAVRARNIVDPTRIAVSGWSYGGVMTTWMITHYHLWKAAVSGAAVTDWIADYAIADDLDADLYLFRGSPFGARNRARWVHEESITYVRDVTTPVLLMADRGDARVANVSSYEFFHALRDLGKPVQFIVYPVDGHFPHDPARTADVYARWMNYIGDHFQL
jgi:dipeptidyl aminopeptidase/acylaminoacyl peptidase